MLQNALRDGYQFATECQLVKYAGELIKALSILEQRNAREFCAEFASVHSNFPK